jgi:hypothetical protein
MSRIVAVRYGKLGLTFQLCMVKKGPQKVELCTRIQHLPSIVALGERLILIRPPIHRPYLPQNTHPPTDQPEPTYHTLKRSPKNETNTTKRQENEEMGTLETLLRNSKVEIHSQNTKQSQISLRKDKWRWQE